ncbi:uncharacterized protein LOC34619335 [Cyclospora cayetanensis]|uniref:Uncharacterized protein LOC34619335 n=1 Tax=Cyclospora cayetanensis TaxID=88456 RepID=A0A6P6RV53_9EIME|nr:uncharacterized protein LOC34619335 [Cyclospora cayetanensis]
MESDGCGWKPEAPAEEGTSMPVRSEGELQGSVAALPLEHVAVGNGANFQSALMPSMAVSAVPEVEAAWDPHSACSTDYAERFNQLPRQRVTPRNPDSIRPSSTGVIAAQHTLRLNGYASNSGSQCDSQPADLPCAGYSNTSGPLQPHGGEMKSTRGNHATCQRLQFSPMPSDVSTCLEDLPLEQLLRRLSERDVQMLMRTIISTSAASSPPASACVLPATKKRNSGDRGTTHQSSLAAPLLTDAKTASLPEDTTESRPGDASSAIIPQIPQYVPNDCHISRSLPDSSQASDALKGEIHQSEKLLVSAKPALEPLSTSAARKIAGCLEAHIQPGPKSKAAGVKTETVKARPFQRTCGVQTTLKLSIADLAVEKALTLYALHNKNKKGNHPQQKSKADAQAVTRESVRAHPENAHTEKALQQSIDFPLLLVGASLLIKENRIDLWDSCTVGAFHALTKQHDVTLASTARTKKLRLCEHQLLINCSWLSLDDRVIRLAGIPHHASISENVFFFPGLIGSLLLLWCIRPAAPTPSQPSFTSLTSSSNSDSSKSRDYGIHARHGASSIVDYNFTPPGLAIGLTPGTPRSESFTVPQGSPQPLLEVSEASHTVTKLENPESFELINNFGTTALDSFAVEESDEPSTVPEISLEDRTRRDCGLPCDAVAIINAPNNQSKIMLVSLAFLGVLALKRPSASPSNSARPTDFGMQRGGHRHH